MMRLAIGELCRSTSMRWIARRLGLLSICASACSAGGGGEAQRIASDGEAPITSTDSRPFGETFLPPSVDFGPGVSGPSVDGEFTGIPGCEVCDDLPAEPIFEDGLGVELQSAFAQAPSGGAGPCIVEPRDGMLIPANMLRPRVHAPGASGVLQITISAERERNDLIVYTRSNPWLIPPSVWNGLRSNVFDEDIVVTVRNLGSGGGAPTESRVAFRIAPVQAGGSMVYWGATTEQPGLETTRLLGFGVGEEAVVTALRPLDVEETMLGDNGEIKREEYGAPRGQARCVGCHTSTGDGEAVITGDHWPWNLAVTDITQGAGGRPPYVTPMGALLMQMPWLGVSTTSRDHWARGRRVLVTSAGPRPAMEGGFVPSADSPERDMGFGQSQNQTGRDGLIWIDMEAAGSPPELTEEQLNEAVGAAMVAARGQGWGVIERRGDPRGAVTPDWSHDGERIAYTSTDSTSDGRVGDNANTVDIHTVAFADGSGGEAVPLPGASEPGVAEYYPDFSADDRYIAFN